ncbi:MAG: MarR family winged helix-turn-helix transcriptional regulator [Acidimicrobiales bacterium]
MKSEGEDLPGGRSSLASSRRPATAGVRDRGVGPQLSRLVQLLRITQHDRLHSFGLTPSQWELLRTVHREPGQSLRALARVIGTDPMAVKRCVDILEDRGLLQRELVSDDRRSRLMCLTSNGERLLRELVACELEQEVRIQSILSAHEYRLFAGLIERLRHELDERERAASRDEVRA